jgi:hypothetical protein
MCSLHSECDREDECPIVQSTNAQMRYAEDHMLKSLRTWVGKYSRKEPSPLASDLRPPRMMRIIVGPCVAASLVISGWLPNINLHWMFPKIQSGHSQFRYSPDTKPLSGVPYIPTDVRKEDLIIQQNSECWLPWAPGETCDPETRTYD